MSNVAIMTNFMEFNPGYSLTGIVLDQARMLTRYGHNVFITVNDQYHGDPSPSISTRGGEITIMPIIPFTHLVDYNSCMNISEEHCLIAAKTAQALNAFIIDMKIDVMFTHDIVFTGWNLPYANGVANMKPSVSCYHWIHSIPSRFSDWWDLGRYGINHTLVYPNQTDLDRVATQFRTTLDKCRAVPHIKDLRTMYEFRQETCDFIDKFPALMQADIVQIYPASTDRLSTKRVKELMHIFKWFKEAGKSTFLLIANQWATGVQRKEDVNLYKAFAKRLGVDYAFTSEFADGIYDAGVSHHILRELMMLGNLFIFPTREETFGLVTPEISLASGALCVMNRSLQCQMEIAGLNALYYDFGSYTNNFHPPESNWDLYSRILSIKILESMATDRALATRTFMRQTYNMDTLYWKYYRGMVEI